MNGAAERSWVMPVIIALSVVFYAALGRVILRGYRRLRRSAEAAQSRAFDGLEVHPVPAPGSVAVVSHTYYSFVAFAIQTEHRFWAPPGDAREALRRLHRFNLTWGMLAGGMVFIPILSYGNYLAQRRAIRRQAASMLARDHAADDPAVAGVFRYHHVPGPAAGPPSFVVRRRRGSRMLEVDSEYLSRYRALGLGGTPCTPEEVAKVEADLHVRLPAAYRAYLLLMGNEPDPVLRGTDCAIGDLYVLGEGAEELLAEDGNPFELPPDAFVFLMHQGYQFMYVICDGTSEDPPVFYYLEGTGVAERKYDRFSASIESCESEEDRA